MKFYDSKGNEVDILETDGGYEEAFVVRAQYLDETLPEEVPDDELQYLTEAYAEYISGEELEKSAMAAEAYYEGDR
jgi:hypothetical protein